MKAIWKFTLGIIDAQSVEMPINAEILCVQVQHDVPCLWARVDPKARKVQRRIITHGTGHPVPGTTGEYVGTYQLQDGAFVGHVFEMKP